MKISTDVYLYTTYVGISVSGIHQEYKVDVTYQVHPGFKGDHTDPPEDASVEIIQVALFQPPHEPSLYNYIDDLLSNSEVFEQELLEIAAEEEAYQAECAAEHKRDEQNFKR